MAWYPVKEAKVSVKHLSLRLTGGSTRTRHQQFSQPVVGLALTLAESEN